MEWPSKVEIVDPWIFRYVDQEFYIGLAIRVTVVKVLMTFGLKMAVSCHRIMKQYAPLLN